MFAGDFGFKAHRLDVLAQGVAVHLAYGYLVGEHGFIKTVVGLGVTGQRPPFALGPGGVKH